MAHIYIIKSMELLTNIILDLKGIRHKIRMY